MTPVSACRRCGSPLDPRDAVCPVCGICTGPACNGMVCATDTDVPATGACVVCGRPVCGRCGRTEYGMTLCADPMHAEILNAWEMVAEVRTPFSADLIRRNLDQHGVRSEAFDHRIFPERSDLRERERVLVFVPGDSVDRAKTLIRDLDLLLEGGESSPSGSSSQ